MDESADLKEIAVSGFSMRFYLNHGDAVRVRRVRAGDLNTGDLVVLLGERRARILPVIHRLMWKSFRGGAWTLWTKGDSSLMLDPISAESALIGKVTAIKRGAGAWKNIDGPFGRLSHVTAGIVSSVIFGSVCLAYMALRRLFLVLSKLPALSWMQGEVIDDRLYFKRIFPDLP